MLRRLTRDRQGSTLVEFTLAVPLLIGLVAGVAEFGSAYRQYHVMQKGVRDAARYLARADGTACPAASTEWTTAISEAKAVALTRSPTGTQPVHKNWTDPATLAVVVDCVDNSTGAWRGGAWKAKVTVRAVAPYRDLGMLSFLGLGPINLTVQHQQLVIGS